VERGAGARRGATRVAARARERSRRAARVARARGGRGGARSVRQARLRGHEERAGTRLDRRLARSRRAARATA
jgi:hypothetical protein